MPPHGALTGTKPGSDGRLVWACACFPGCEDTHLFSERGSRFWRDGAFSLYLMLGKMGTFLRSFSVSWVYLMLYLDLEDMVPWASGSVQGPRYIALS